VRATEALRRGYNLLIFPEGTRSRDGRMASFKPTAGYLALQCQVDTLPVYLVGTHDALPPGRGLPRREKLRVLIGQPIRIADLRARTAALAKGDAHKAATQIMEEAVKALEAKAKGASPPGRGDGLPEPDPHRSETPRQASSPAAASTPGASAGAVPMKAKGDEP